MSGLVCLFNYFREGTHWKSITYCWLCIVNQFQFEMFVGSSDIFFLDRNNNCWTVSNFNGLKFILLDAIRCHCNLFGTQHIRLIYVRGHFVRNWAENLFLFLISVSLIMYCVYYLVTRSVFTLTEVRRNIILPFSLIMTPPFNMMY